VTISAALPWSIDPPLIHQVYRAILTAGNPVPCFHHDARHVGSGLFFTEVLS
jgi:hypothetical protein